MCHIWFAHDLAIVNYSASGHNADRLGCQTVLQLQNSQLLSQDWRQTNLYTLYHVDFAHGRVAYVDHSVCEKNLPRRVEEETR